MKFQKFYIYFCSLSWVIWLISIVTLDAFWNYSIFDSTVSKLALISGLFSITPIYPVFSIIALVKSIKSKNKLYIIFNIISMIITFILGFLNFIYCIVYYSGGVWFIFIKRGNLTSLLLCIKTVKTKFWKHRVVFIICNYGINIPQDLLLKWNMI